MEVVGFDSITIITMNMVLHPLTGIDHSIAIMVGQMAMEVEVILVVVLVVEVFIQMVGMVILTVVQV